jgi:hypothetical protein
MLGDPHIDVIGDFGAAVAREQDRAPGVDQVDTERHAERLGR